MLRRWRKGRWLDDVVGGCNSRIEVGGRTIGGWRKNFGAEIDSGEDQVE